MRFIETTIPPTPAVIKEKFLDPTVVYVVDYANSTLKGKTFLAYLTNLELDYRIKIEDVTTASELLTAYLEMTTMVRSVELEELTINMLLAYNNLPHDLDFDPQPFISDNGELLSRWNSLIGSMEVYMASTVSGLKGVIADVSVVEGSDMTGCNFANLLKYPEFTLISELVEDAQRFYYRHLFEGYVFSGNNLFYYWQNEDNPYYVMSELMHVEGFDGDEFRKLSLEYINDSIEVMTDVPSL